MNTPGLSLFRVKNLLIFIAAILLLGVLLNLINRKSDAAEDYSREIPNASVSFEMVYIPGGEFQMGSPEDEEGREEDEGPVHTVQVSPFWIGKYEVTWDQYEQYYLGQVDAISGASPKLNWTWTKIFVQRILFDLGLPYFEYDAITRPSPFYGAPDHGWGRRTRPVVGVSLKAANKYCEWLSIKTGEKYRLPTEAEWEYACRAGSNDMYFFGDDENDLEEYAWYWDNSNDQTQPAGKKEPNKFGLYDMLGNVWEYCSDIYDAEYYTQAEKSGTPVDPKGPDKEGKPVLRGGSWDDDPDVLRAANRLEAQDWWNERDPQLPKGTWWLVDGNMIGFRLARSAD